MNDWRRILTDWAGKSPIEDVGPSHPAVYHMLDVAAVAEVLVGRNEGTKAQKQAIVLLVALHDLGKIGNAFRNMLNNGTAQGKAHWEVSEALLRYHDELLQPALGGDQQARYELYAAIAGHHGKPPISDRHHMQRMVHVAGLGARTDAGAVIELFLSLWPDASLASLEVEDAREMGWWLSGLTVASDWIGSNTDWFAAHLPNMAPDAYLAKARKIAEVAVREAGLAGGCTAGQGPLLAFDLRPMQFAATNIALNEGPMLAIMEDETGSGKTEAALILARRMISEKKADGLYFALPTMATSDAMFARLESLSGRLLSGSPSIALAHGRAGVNPAFRKLIGHVRTSEDDAGCAPWIADSRRRALLADIGVGTVDQALLAVLPTRFATLRLWGLSQRILIVDEAHSYDDGYTSRLLETLLRVHAAQGGSAILMTATLPLEMRARLESAFAQGAGYTHRVRTDREYPVLSVSGREPEIGMALPSPKGPVTIERISDARAAADLVARHARQGAAVLWVRNAVDDAMAAVAMLMDQGVKADILHARMALCDRQAAEAKIRAQFGPDGTDRMGRVLVATQVVESSLDLDFDVMVSDLAPMGMLVQRAGRLWRHMKQRPAETRPVSSPVLHVLSPDPEQVIDSCWLFDVLDGGAWVYAHDVQWRTADALFKAGKIDAPTGLRDLIEAAHGREGAELPEPLLAAEREREGGWYGERQHGADNLIKFDLGYREGGGGADDTSYPTRLGPPTRVLALARRDGRAIRPWSNAGGALGWTLSELQVQEHRLVALNLPDQGSPDIAVAKSDWPDWRQNAVTVCPVDEKGQICIGLRYDAQIGLIFE
ncbi:CRISPR-associated helicase Cas3' [Planktotalea arctica]|uniref:CRISPR-associated helicase Cas3' n=1 Tax=Planktotalea arctica TaxID=1481893 RepID=UPI003219352E